MNESIQLNERAHKLRKAGSYSDALILYREGWDKFHDKYAGAGLLNCFRKLRFLDEAVSLANELISKFPDFDWCRLEVIWTYIEAFLENLDEKVPLENIVHFAKKILILNPEGFALNKIVFTVLKAAKRVNNWDVIRQWVDKLDPSLLSAEQMEDSSGRKGWSQQALWFNYKIRSLVEIEEYFQAISLVEKCSEKFPYSQQKFFIRLKALAQYRLGNLNEAERLYSGLCKNYRVDWWLLYEYAQVISDSGRKEEGLKLMYQAAQGSNKIEALVTLFYDIGISCRDLHRNVEARDHLILSRIIREKNDWKVPQLIEETILELNKLLGNEQEQRPINEILKQCIAYWRQNGIRSEVSNGSNKRKVRSNLKGKVKLGYSERPFFYIETQQKESFFGYKTDLPDSLTEEDVVNFDAIPSFDKKKNKESWKAKNIKKVIQSNDAHTTLQDK